jgi:glutamate---cysteine ligase / carboxylate-amine ligase
MGLWLPTGPEHAMTVDSPRYLFGVEEELQILDVDGALCQRIDELLPEVRGALGSLVAGELYQSQVETGTPICASLDRARAELTRLRTTVIEGAERIGCRIGAAGTHPFSHWREQRITPKSRYLNLRLDNRQLVEEQVVFGCHVHVGLPSKEAAVRTMNQVRVWLPALLALTGNSPFWNGDDTGYASFRAELWRRWPVSGPPNVYASHAEYDGVSAALVKAGVIREATKLYWDVRPSERYDTLEFRITDVQTSVDETVMVAGLVRALARTCHEEAVRGAEPPAVRPELLTAARWLAARDGVEGRLLDPETFQPLPAAAVIERLLAFIRPALEEHRDWQLVAEQVARTMAEGTGAARQRAVYAKSGRVHDVIERIVEDTARV